MATRVGVFALAVLGAAYTAAVLAASGRPSPWNWGFHLPAFLASGTRAGILAVLVASATGVVLGAFRDLRGTSAPGNAAVTRRKRRPVRERRHGSTRRQAEHARPLFAAFLVLYGLLLYLLRVRSYFLGDGIVWLQTLRGGTERPFNEPLAALAWKAFAGATGALGLPPEPSTFALLPVLCGIAAAAIAWLLVGEAIEGRRERALAWGLLLTAGFTQIYFGYIESYAIVSVPLFAFLWLALRHARGADPPWLCGLCLALAIATHLVSLFLAPAYALAISARHRSWGGRLALVAFPFALAALVLVLSGSGPQTWLGPFRTAAQASLLGREAAHLARPYSPVSLGHAADFANALFLAIPVPVILLSAWIASRARNPLPVRPASRVLAAAALSGCFAAATLSLPVAPAQDWDLTGLLLIPAGIAGVVAGTSLTGGRNLPFGIALLGLSTSALLAFVLVNADEGAGIRRFEMLMRPDARISRYGRGYGASMLSEFFEDRGDQTSALTFARAALDAEQTNARYWIRVGTILYNERRYPEAIRSLEEAIRRGTVRAEAYDNLGLCYAKLGRLHEAAGQFRAAIAVDPDRPDYRHNLGLVLFDSGQRDSARVVWDEVLRRWPGYPLTTRAMERHLGSPPPAP